MVVIVTVGHRRKVRRNCVNWKKSVVESLSQTLLPLGWVVGSRLLYLEYQFCLFDSEIELYQSTAEER